MVVVDIKGGDWWFEEVCGSCELVSEKCVNENIRS